jgi:ABC-type sugar transport system substrate-binding protein
MVKRRSGGAPPGRRSGARFCALGLAAVSALAVAACGSSSSGGSAAAKPPATSATTGSSCGTTVPVGPSNTTGVYASLSPTLKALYASYPYTLSASPWANHKFPKPPWKIGFIGYPSVNEYFIHRLASLKTDFAAAKAKGLVTGSLLTGIPPSYAQLTPEFQIAAIQQMIREGVNLILLEPASSALATEIDAAAKQGVVIALADDLMPTSKYAIPLFTENYAQAEAGLLGIIKKGNILIVRGAQGSLVDTMVYNQVIADVKRCPDVHVIGSVYGEYATATAKTVVEQFLASHPGVPIAGVVDAGGMFAGIAEAFQSVGRAVPPMSNTEPAGGELSWWLQHKSSYHEVAQGISGSQAAYAWFNIALRILDNRVPKLNVIEIEAPVMTSTNLAEFAPAGESLAFPSDINGPVTAYCTQSCVNSYFTLSGGPST